MLMIDRRTREGVVRVRSLQLKRYRADSEYAARFCQAMLSRCDKISHIQAQAWTGAAN